LKYTRDAANYIKKQLENPEDEFIRLVGRQIHDGSVTKTVCEQLRPAIQAALDEVIRDRIQDKLSITLRPEVAALSQTQESATESEDVITSDDEREGFHIVRAIAAKWVAVDRIVMRDSKSYCAILMDDNNRRPICRLYFNSEKTRYLGLFDSAKNEAKVRVETPADLYKHAEAIENIVRHYSEQKM
jgi:hypothetical protein